MASEKEDDTDPTPAVTERKPYERPRASSGSLYPPNEFIEPVKNMNWGKGVSGANVCPVCKTPRADSDFYLKDISSHRVDVLVRIAGNSQKIGRADVRACRACQVVYVSKAAAEDGQHSSG